MLSFKLYIIFIILLFLFIFFINKKCNSKKLKTKENFSVLGSPDDICPTISVIEEDIIIYKNNTFNEGYFYINKDNSIETQDKKDSPRNIYYIEERLQPFYITNIIGLKVSKNYLFVIDNVFNIKYCKLNNNPTYNLNFNYLLDKNYLKNKTYDIEFIGTSYNSDYCAISIINNSNNKTKHIILLDVNNDVVKKIKELDYSGFSTDDNIIDIYLKKNEKAIICYILSFNTTNTDKLELRKYSDLNTIGNITKTITPKIITITDKKNIFNYRIYDNINEIVVKTHKDIFGPEINKQYLLTQKSEFINDNTIKTQIKNIIKKDDLYSNKINIDKKHKSYLIDKNILKKNEQTYSIIFIDDSKITDYKLVLQKYLNKTNFLIGFYNKVSNNKNEQLDYKKDLYARINKKPKKSFEHILIPSFKFNLQNSEQEYFFPANLNINKNNIKISLYKYFQQAKLNNKKDWLYIYTALKNAGIYYPNREGGFDKNLSRINSVIKNNDYIVQKNKFNKKHRDLIFNNKFYEIFDYYKNPNNAIIYPNIFIYKGLNHNGKQYKHILLNYEMDKSKKINREIEDKDKIFIGLMKTDDDNKREMLNLNRNFYNYSLVNISLNDYNLLNDDPSKLVFNWELKEINNFKEFHELLKDDTNEINLERERLRGLFEIDEMFIDETYINHLLKIKDTINDNRKMDFTKFNELIDIQKNKMNNNCTEKNNILINTIGYPFRVIFKTVDKQGNICSIDSDKIGKQKIFLMNNISNEDYHIDTNRDKLDTLFPFKDNIKEKNIYKNIYSIEKRDITSTGEIKLNDNHQYINSSNKKIIKYPFLKQEFISYTGFGNSIQFYEETIDSIADVDIASVCKNYNASINLEDIDNCDIKKNICLSNEIGYVNLDGTPKCEIQDVSVLRNNDTENEKKLLGIVPQSACKLYIKLGDSTYYYKFSRIVTNLGNKKVQNENEYLIQWIDHGKNKNTNTYLRKNNNEIILSKLEKTELEEFKFYRYKPEEMLRDNYGSYIMFTDSENGNNILTIKYNIFNPLDLEYKMESLYNTVNERNNFSNNYLKNKQFYTQKFLLDESLLRNINANDNIKSESNNDLNNINSLSDQLDNNSDIVSTNLSIEEEIKLGQKVNNYLTDNYNKTQTFKKALKDGDFNINVESLYKKLNIQEKNIENATTNVKRKLDDNTKYMVLGAINNQNMKLIDKKINELENENNIIRTNSVGINSNVKVNNMTYPPIPTTENIKKINLLLKKNRENYKPKCSNIEEFSNMYSDKKMNQHIIDKYQKYIVDNIDKTKCNLDKKNREIKDNLVKLQELSKTVNNNSNYKELKLNEELNKNDDLNRDIFRIKNYEQDHRLSIINKKIEDLKRLRCRLKIKHKKNANDKYNSIISKEDAELLNVYKLDKCEKKKHKLEDLNLNKILINGGCLTYNQKENVLSSKHCIIGNNEQIFEVEKINSQQDLIDKNYDLENTNSFDKPFYIIKKNMTEQKKIKENNNILQDDKFICPLEKNNNKNDNKNNEVCPPDLDKYLCLHKENGTLNLRSCENIKNQQWIYSTSSGNCE